MPQLLQNPMSIENNLTMSQSIDVAEGNQQDHWIKITEDVPKALDASLGDIKLKLDLTEDSTPISLHDTFIENVAKGIPSAIIEESETTEQKTDVEVTRTEKIKDHTTEEHDHSSTENTNGRKRFTLWVSNITHNVRANDLKKLFSKSGNVLSAKILTNGKNFYGCVALETCEQATQCLKELNNSVVEGNTIHISKNRPDMKQILLENKSRSKAKNVEKQKEKNKCIEKCIVETKTADGENILKSRDSFTDKLNQNKKLISDLEKRLKNAHADLSRMKRKLEDCERKNLMLERNSRKEMEKIRSERRRLNQDKENFEKSKREFQKEITKEKASVLKELDEAKALRIKLQNRLDNFLTSTPRPKRRSRSPLLRNNRNNIDRTSSLDDRRQKDREWRTSKRPRKDNPVTTKVFPPSPPRLTEFDRRGSQRNEHFLNSRPYYPDERQQSAPEKVSNFRQKIPFDNFSRDHRNSYPMTYIKDDPKHQVHVQSFTNDRFGNPVQNAPQVLGPSRIGHNPYVPEFSKHYGHY